MTALTKAENKEPVQSGNPIAALVPTTIDETFRLAKALSLSGDMVPKHFQGKPEMIMAAIVRGMEIGLAPMQALSNIAVINGRASIWGDALPAIVQRAGHFVDVEFQGEGDAMEAVATLTRGDTGREVVRRFSVADAKKAGLWGKAGPWQSYPKRMLSHRARAWAVRDGAADALMGLSLAEEMQDVAPMRDVTPKAGGFAQMAERARLATETNSGSDMDPDENGSHPARGEPEAGGDGSPLPENSPPVDNPQEHPVADAGSGRQGSGSKGGNPPPAEEGSPLGPDGIDPSHPAYGAGQVACMEGFDRRDCPHADGSPDAAQWLAGWDQANG